MGVEEILALISFMCIGLYCLLYLIDKIHEYRFHPKQMPKVGERYRSKDCASEKHEIVVEDVDGAQIKFSVGNITSILHVTYFLECYELEKGDCCCGTKPLYKN